MLIKLFVKIFLLMLINVLLIDLNQTNLLLGVPKSIFTKYLTTKMNHFIQ